MGHAGRVALQFHRPARKVAALLMSFAAVVAVACGLLVTRTSFTVVAAGMAPFLLPILAACALHPSARAFLRLPRLDPRMFALSVIAACPWIAYAVGVSGAAREAGPDVYIAAFGFHGDRRPPEPAVGTDRGDRHTGLGVFPAGAAVLASACLGLQSLMFPDVLSGLEPLWAGAAVAWCIAYGVAAWHRSRRA